jgi:hypothetical protein
MPEDVESSSLFEEQCELADRWATIHKTFIVLNGDDNSQLMNGAFHTTAMQPVLPWRAFIEPGLGNIVTCVAVIVPEEYFNATWRAGDALGSPEYFESVKYGSKFTAEPNTRTNSSKELSIFNFIKLLKGSNLAR